MGGGCTYFTASEVPVDLHLWDVPEGRAARDSPAGRAPCCGAHPPAATACP